MSMFGNPSNPNPYGKYLAELLLIGGVQLERLTKGKKQVTFKDWSETVRQAVSQPGTSLTDRQLEWLWEALTTEPRILREFLGRIVSREEEWKRQDFVPILKRGEMLGVFLKPFTLVGAPILRIPPETKSDSKIRLLETLEMGPGKLSSRRFECRDVTAEVEIQVAKLGRPDEEAILMKLELGNVDVKGRSVIASVRSLNHAFTVTSRRLQPHCRNHGGRIYDHIAWRQNNQWISLEDIRREVEAGKWKVA